MINISTNNQSNVLLILVFLVIAVSCSPTEIMRDAEINVSSKEHNFNSLPYKKEAEYSFQFTNPGKTPLLIFDVKTSCGCTVPEWTKKPIKPGKSGEIKIKYDAAFPGVFHKEILVYYNGQDSPVKLSIKGQVEYPDDLEGAVE